MNRIGKVAAGAGLGLALWVAPAMGQSDFVRPVGPPGAGRCAENLVRALQLTSVQQASLDALREESAEAIRPVIEQLHALREQIEEAAAAPSADPCDVGAMAIEAGGIRSRIDAMRQAAEARFVATLAADQKARYEEYVAIHPNCLAVGGGGFFFRSLP